MYITEEIMEKKNTRQPYLQSYVIPDMKKKRMNISNLVNKEKQTNKERTNICIEG
jgi:hypothetical protein